MSVSIQTIPRDQSPDVAIVGAGVIGLAIALELHDRGARVAVVERGRSLMGASMAAAGMLAVDDPYNPPELRTLSRLSVALYPKFLRRIDELAGIGVPFQTETTIQYLESGAKVCLAENSLEPRQLGAALLAAVRATSIALLEEMEVAAVDETLHGVKLTFAGGTSGGTSMDARAVVYAAGCWTTASMLGMSADANVIRPRKGQMLRVKLPETLALQEVHRSERIYVVPRTQGSQAGTALIGATVEDAGFDTAVHASDLANLRELAAELVPALRSERDAPMVEAWAGLRPATVDSLPILGMCRGKGVYVASGHYRNGILLAPATAVVMADVIEGKTPAVDLLAFSPDRFSGVAAL